MPLRARKRARSTSRFALFSRSPTSTGAATGPTSSVRRGHRANARAGAVVLEGGAQVAQAPLELDDPLGETLDVAAGGEVPGVPGPAQQLPTVTLEARLGRQHE